MNHLSWRGLGRSKMSCPLMPAVGGRAGPEDMRVGELTLPLISCNAHMLCLGNIIELALKV